MPLSNFNFNEIGSVIYVNIGEDVSSSTPTLIIEPEVGDKKEITDGVTIPNSTIVVDNETLTANQYIKYTTKDGDLDYAGRWRKKASLKFSDADIKQSDYVKFRVLP